jgi:hypothetical protein
MTQRTVHILLGSKAETAAWVRENAGQRYVAVSPHGSCTILRGLSGPITVLTFEGWAAASARLIDAVERDLAIIQATQPKPASPAGELRQAAQHIRTMAGEPVTWHAHDGNLDYDPRPLWIVSSEATAPGLDDSVAEVHVGFKETAQHIALWDTAIAVHVADLLDYAARIIGFYEPEHYPAADPWMALARAINAKTSGT